MSQQELVTISADSNITRLTNLSMITKQIIMVVTILFGTLILMTTQKMEFIVIVSNAMKQGYMQVLVLILSLSHLSP